jgi:hypothetical protein
MTRTSKYMILLALWFNILATSLSAQVKVQVVSQSVSKKIDYTTGMSLVISGEHADIYCTEIEENTIGIDLEIISKNEDRAMAESDIKKMKWLVEVKAGICYARNYIELAKNEPKPVSSLKAVYHIKIPRNCPVEIRDYFGNIVVDSLQSSLTINSEFTPIRLQDVSGIINVNTVFGDLSIIKINGESTITSNRSNIDMSGLSGKFLIDATSATIHLRDLHNIKTFGLTAQGSAIDLTTHNPFSYTYKLYLSVCELHLPYNLNPDQEKNEKSETRSVYNLKQGLPIIEFNLENSALTIEQSND